jgi:hypothetical protein
MTARTFVMGMGVIECPVTSWLEVLEVHKVMVSLVTRLQNWY